MTTGFLHGAEVVQIDSGTRPIRTVRASVIGLIGTAPDADANAFPANTPVLVTNNRLEAAQLDTTGDGKGTLPSAIDAIFDQAGAVVVVVRVAEGADDAATLANIIGGQSGGEYTGVHAFIGAQSEVGVTPRLLIAPGFMGDRVDEGIQSVVVDTPGTGYSTDTTAVVDGAGSGAEVSVEVNAATGAITGVTVIKPGDGYSGTPSITLTDPSGAGENAAFTVNAGPAGNPVVAELIGIADKLKGIVIADGPNTNDSDAIAYRGDWGSRRVYIVDPAVRVSRGGAVVTEPASPRVAGLIAKSDADRGFWWSPSNRVINGIIGVARPIDFDLGDRSSRANILNENEVTTIIREDGFRLWGNRTASSDPKWAFLNVVRTADIIGESILRAHLWAVDRNITRTYLEDVAEGVNAFLRELEALGAILGGRCWPDPDLNTPETLAAGKVYFNFDFTPPAPAEQVTFRAILTNDYYEDII